MSETKWIFREGEKVVVAPISKEEIDLDDRYHYLQEGAIVTIIRIEGVNKDFITVQGDHTSFVTGNLGWWDNTYGDYCQEVTRDHLLPLDNTRRLPNQNPHPQTQLPSI